MRKLFFTCTLFLAVFLVWLVLGPAAYSQKLGDREVDLRKLHDFRILDTWTKLLNGDQPGPRDQAVIEGAAKYFVFRVASPDNLSDPKDPQKMEKVIEDFQSRLINRMVPKSSPFPHKNFVQMMSKHLVECFKEIFALDFNDKEKRIILVNAAQMLPALAKLKQDDVGDFLVKLIKDDKTHEAIKVYALRGMQEFFPVKFSNKNDAERVQVLIDYIHRQQWPQARGAAINYLRREAIHSLAQAQVPFLGPNPPQKGAKAEGAVAHVLLEVLKGNGMNPASSLGEKFEAAVGLCQIKSSPEYLPDWSVYMVGKFTVECFKDYNVDWAEIGGKGAKKPPLYPWKIWSKRLNAAFDDLISSTRQNADAQGNAKKMEKLCKSPLAAMDNPTEYKQIDNINIQDLSRAVDGFRPKAGTPLFKTLGGPIFTP